VSSKSVPVLKSPALVVVALKVANVPGCTSEAKTPIARREMRTFFQGPVPPPVLGREAALAWTGK
jgi:hypothetical protein